MGTGSLVTMSESFEFHVADDNRAGSVNGLVCAFALLVDALEANGALKPKQFEGILSSVLHQAGDDGDVGVLQQILSLLASPERPQFTVIAGGKT